MSPEDRDTYVVNLLELQRDMVTLTRASTMIRQVLPKAAPAVVALEEEVMRRFRAVRQIRELLGREPEEVKLASGK